MEYLKVLLPLFLVFVLGDIIARKKDSLIGAAIFQPGSTILIIITAWVLQPDKSSPFHTMWIFVFAGLVVSLIGDILMVKRGDLKKFVLGMGCFAIALILYSIPLSQKVGFHRLDWMILPVLLILFGTLSQILNESLGKLRMPILAYTALFTFLLSRGIATHYSGGFTSVQALCLTLGIASFFLGDLQLAIFTFRSKKFPMLWAPAYYFFGQMLIALNFAFI